MEVLQYPDKKLSKKNSDFKFTKENLLWLDDFCKFYEEKLPWNKLGLAAPQLGKNIRAIIVNGKLLLNPEYIFRSGKMVNYFPGGEACFSIDHGLKYFPIRRKSLVKIKYQDMDQNWHEEMISGALSAVVQHEMDHMEGKLCH